MEADKNAKSSTTICNVSKTIPVNVLLEKTEGNISGKQEGQILFPGGCLSIPVDFEGGVAKMLVKSASSKVFASDFWKGIIPLKCNTSIKISPEKKEVEYREQILPQLEEKPFTSIFSRKLVLLGALILLIFLYFYFRKRL